MMKKARHILGLILICVLALGMTACGKKVADEEQIKQELESNQEIRFLKNGEQIDEIVIEKRQTDKNQKTDTVWCTVVTNDTEVSYQKNAVLTYGLYDEGWMLDDVDVNSKDQWIYTPLKGISENGVLDSLQGQTVIVENEEWVITQDSLIKAEVFDQQTDLNSKKDQVTVSLILDDEVERAEGKLTISYFFDQEWVLDSVLSNGEFAAAMKEEYALNVTEDDLISKMTETEIPFTGTADNGVGMVGQQTLSSTAQEISDFKIDEHKSESKGCRQIYQCSYNLNKSHVTLGVEAMITYMHQNEGGWTSSVSDVTSKVISADIEGNWVGTYIGVPWNGRSELNISEVQADGTVTATYRFVPEAINSSSSEGSYELSGHWDYESLELFLEAGDWIETPIKETIFNSKENITAELDIEKGQLEGYAQAHNVFKVKMENEGE